MFKKVPSIFLKFIFVACIFFPSSFALANSFEKGLDYYDKGKFSEAFSTWEKLANNGHLGSQFNLAVLYEQGVGVSKDLQQAAKWYRKAAEQKDINAQFALAKMFEQGIGVDKNLGEARKWFSRVISNSDTSADARSTQEKAKNQLDIIPKAIENLEVKFEGGRFVFNEASNGYCVIALQGRITNDTTYQFTKVIKMAKSLGCETNWVLLESGGGSLADGIKLGREMHFEGYKTIARHNCASSCGLIFMGGVERILYGANAKIGLHQASQITERRRTGQNERWCASDVHSPIPRDIRSYLRFMIPNTAAEIFDLIMKTSCDSILWVNGQKALDLGIATKLQEPNLILKITTSPFVND
jgi:hypothetical protein